MKKFGKFCSFVVAVIFIVLIFAFNRKTNVEIKAYNGVLNLLSWDFNQDGCVKLQGKWDLYYDKLLMPQDIKNKKADSYYNIPGRLDDQVHGKTQGYMTLHLKIYVPKDGNYGIYFNSLFSSSDIWINGVYLGGHGRVGKDIKSERAIYKPQYIFFQSAKGKIDIVIHTSTFRDLEPRLKAATFGTEDQIKSTMYKNVGIDGFTIGIMFATGILSLGLYFMNQKQKRNIYFAVICLVMIVRCLVFNSRLLVQFYPNMDFEVLSKIAAITFYLFVTFYILFLNDMFQNRIVIKNAAVLFGVGFTILCIFTNNIVYDSLGACTQYIAVFFILYLCVFLCREIYRKNPDGKKNFFPFIMIAITGLNDMLVNNAILYDNYFIFLGVIIFVIAQLGFIANDYLENYKKLDKLKMDGLTSLYNNKYIKKLLSKHLNDYNKKGKKFSLLMLDIDNFKGINDNFGHMFGDTIIIDVACILRRITRNKGYAGRFGGDEFIIILPETYEKEALTFAKNIMKELKDLNGKYDIDKEISLSIGVRENSADNLEQCINDVDNLMYKSKSSGKNCINGERDIM